MTAYGDQSSRASTGPSRVPANAGETPYQSSTYHEASMASVNDTAWGGAGFPAKRFSASIVILAAGVLSGLASISSWWTLSESGSSYTGSLSFLPGDSYQATGEGVSASGTYAGDGLGPVGALYEGILAIVLVVLIIALAAGIIGFVTSLSRNSSPARYRTVRNLIVVAFVLSAFAAVLVPTLQAYLFHSANPSGICSSTGGTQTPCNSFWGSLSSDGESATWGSDIGWYLALATTILSLGGLFVWQAGKDEAWSRSPYSSQGGLPMGSSDGGYLSHPTHVTSPSYQSPPAETASQPAVGTPSRFCPACGAANSSSYSFCQRCGRQLPPAS